MAIHVALRELAASEDLWFGCSKMRMARMHSPLARIAVIALRWPCSDERSRAPRHVHVGGPCEARGARGVPSAGRVGPSAAAGAAPRSLNLKDRVKRSLLVALGSPSPLGGGRATPSDPECGQSAGNRAVHPRLCCELLCAASPHETSTHRAAARDGAMSDGHTSRPHRAPSHTETHTRHLDRF